MALRARDVPGLTKRLGLKDEKAHKFGAKRTVLDGEKFDSQLEANRWAELRILERAGEIHNLGRQPAFPLEVLDRPHRTLGVYRADFEYCVCPHPERCEWSHRVVEDAKGYDVPLQRWKRRHAELQYGIAVRLV